MTAHNGHIEQEHTVSATLFVAWRSGGDTDGAWGPVGRVDFDGTQYRFMYTKGAKTLAGFQPFPGMPELHTVYVSGEPFPFLANRIMSPRRTDYAQWLSWSGFSEDTFDPMAVLAVTEGRRQTDSLELFPCPRPDKDGNYTNRFFLHGLRWAGEDAVQRIKDLKAGSELRLLPDNENEYDRFAVGVHDASDDKLKLGYTPRYLARDIRTLIERCEDIDLHVEQVNRSAPMQNRLLCSMRSCWPQEFEPCSDEAYQPLVASSIGSTCADLRNETRERA